jgi:hypothetical protein
MAKGVVADMATRILTTDSRGRLSLGRPDHHFIVREEEDGTVTLEPAVVMSELEHRYPANAAVRAQVEYARQHPDQRVPRKRRS